MANNFDLFYARVLKDEGTKFENVAGDNGGPTCCGVTIFDVARFNNFKVPGNLSALRKSKDYPTLLRMVQELNPTTARAVYKRYYWDDIRGDDLPAGLDYAVADYATNSGEGRAAKVLNALVGLKGSQITDATLAAVRSYGSLPDLITHFQDERRAFMIAISEPTPKYMHNVKFRKGWLDREARVRKASLDLAAREEPQKPVVVAAKAVDPETLPPDPAPTTVRMVKESKTVKLQVSAVACAAVAKSKALAVSIGGAFAWFVEQLPDVTKEAGDHVSAVKDAANLVGATEFVAGTATVLGVVFAVWVIVRHVNDRKELKALKGAP